MVIRLFLYKKTRFCSNIYLLKDSRVLKMSRYSINLCFCQQTCWRVNIWRKKHSRNILMILINGSNMIKGRKNTSLVTYSICVFDIQTFQRFGFSRQAIPDDEFRVFQTVTKLLALVEKSSRTLWYTAKQSSRLCTLTSVRRPLSWPFSDRPLSWRRSLWTQNVFSKKQSATV